MTYTETSGSVVYLSPGSTVEGAIAHTKTQVEKRLQSIGVDYITEYDGEYDDSKDMYRCYVNFIIAGEHDVYRLFSDADEVNEHVNPTLTLNLP